MATASSSAVSPSFGPGQPLDEIVIIDGPNVGRFRAATSRRPTPRASPRAPGESGGSSSSSRAPTNKGGGKHPPIETELILNAYDAVLRRFPAAKIEVLVYQPDLDRWDREGDPHIEKIRDHVTHAPSRSDVDDAVLQEALKFWQQGKRVRILSNDNYDVYREDVAVPKTQSIAGVTKEWLQRVLWKFSFSTIDSSCNLVPVEGLPRREDGGTAMEAEELNRVSEVGRQRNKDVIGRTEEGRQEQLCQGAAGQGQSSSSAFNMPPSPRERRVSRTASADADMMDVDMDLGADDAAARPSLRNEEEDPRQHPGRASGLDWQSEWLRLTGQSEEPGRPAAGSRNNSPQQAAAARPTVSPARAAAEGAEEGEEIYLENGFEILRKQREEAEAAAALGPRPLEVVENNGHCDNLGPTASTFSIYRPAPADAPPRVKLDVEATESRQTAPQQDHDVGVEADRKTGTTRAVAGASVKAVASAACAKRTSPPRAATSSIAKAAKTRTPPRAAARAKVDSAAASASAAQALQKRVAAAVSSATSKAAGSKTAVIKADDKQKLRQAQADAAKTAARAKRKPSWNGGELLIDEGSDDEDARVKSTRQKQKAKAIAAEKGLQAWSVDGWERAKAKAAANKKS